MGCFSNCFGNSKRRRRSRRRPINASPSSLLDHLQKYESVEDFKIPQLVEDGKIENSIDPSPIDSPSRSSDEKREKANVSERKKVTFDLNVKIYEDLPKEKEEEGEEVEEAFVNGDSEGTKKEEAASDSSSSSLFSYPSNHRYQNCRDSDDEFDEILSSDESEIDNYTDEEEEEDDDDYDEEEEVDVNHEKPVTGAQDQSSGSLFSLSLESKVQNSEDNKEVNSPMATKNQTSNGSNSNHNARFDRSKYVESVLNPVENVSQWKVIKAKSRRAASKEDWEAKENLERAHDSGFKVRNKEEKEIAVDTSLSGWLGGSPDSKNSSSSVGNSESVTANNVSPKKFEDRPILGALTVDEIRQFSASPSPRKSPGWSPDDKPIIGSVGSYWSHTGQNNKSGSSTRSKFTENAKVIWDPTPFETRLEKALEEAGTVEQDLRG